MRTMFVNPGKRRRKRRKNAPKRWKAVYRKAYPKSPAATKSRKRRARKSNPKTSINISAKELKTMLSKPRRRSKARRRSRRRNAGITPFVQNPMMYSNPRHRRSGMRRRRRNPGLSLPSLSLNRIVSKSLTYGGGAAIGTLTNVLALNKIQNHWLRNGARVLVGCLGAPMLKGELGAAAAGALFSPMVVELAAFLKLPIATETDLSADIGVDADLADILNGEDDDSYVGVDASLF